MRKMSMLNVIKLLFDYLQYLAYNTISYNIKLNGI